MSTKTPPRRPGESELPELEAEREVDLRRHWNAIAARWWLPVAGVVIGIVIGYLTTVGGRQVYQAKTTVYLGQPLSPQGSTQIQSQATNPSAVGQIIHDENALRQAAGKAGMPVGQLRGHVSSQAVAGSLAKLGQTPLVRISVTGSSPRKIQKAANALAAIVIERTSGYVETKISSFKKQLAAQAQALKSIDQTITLLREGASARGLSTVERLILASQLNGQTLQRSQVVDAQAQTTQLLSVAETVERGQVFIRAVPVKTTARSRRNSVIVGALIGLIIGILAALLWEPVLRVVRRTP
jgi:hypothetical protein